MKKILGMAAIIVCVGLNAKAEDISQCKDVNLKEVIGTLDNVINTCPNGSEINKWLNEQLKGTNKLCALRILQAGQAKKKLDEDQTKIYNLLEDIALLAH